MVPGGRIIAGPGESITLAARISGAGQNKRTLVRSQFQQTFKSAAGIFQSDDVVDLGVGRRPRSEAGLFDAMHGVERHGLAGSVEDRGLVHVVPESGDAILNELMVEATPPLASLGASEIGKYRRTRPHNADELAAVGLLDEVISGMACVVGLIVLVGQVCDVQVGDVDQMEMLLAQIGNKSRKIGESLRINREGAILDLIVDVEIDDVGRDLVGAQTIGNPP